MHARRMRKQGPRAGRSDRLSIILIKHSIHIIAGHMQTVRRMPFGGISFESITQLPRDRR